MFLCVVTFYVIFIEISNLFAGYNSVSASTTDFL